MTISELTSVQPTRLRRATFIPSPAEVTARRLHVGVTVAAAVVSAAAVGVVAPLVF